MANRYWVGGAGTWNTSSTTNWSTSSGGSSGASVPTAADSVFFDQAGTYTVTCTGALTCLDITVSAGTVTFADGTSPTFAISGSMSLVAGTVWSATGTITFNATTTGKTITTNGVSVGKAITFNGVGGGWTLGSAWTSTASSAPFLITNGTLNTSASNYAITLSSTGAITVNGGTLTCNGSTITSQGFTLSSGTINANSATLNLSSSVTISGGTFNAGTSQITISGGSALTLAGNGSTFYNVTFSNNPLNSTITGANTFNNLSFPARASAGINTITIGANQTINGTLTVSAGANATLRSFVISDTIGTTRTFTCAAISSLSDVDFRDITIAGAAAPVSGTRLGDCKGNSGITFDAAKTVYWNLAGAQNWSATGWATSSGGSPSVNNFPLAQDTAVFDNTGSVTGTISINADWKIGTLDMSARTSAMTIAPGNNQPNIYGNFLFGTGVTLTGTSGTSMLWGGRTIQTITSSGRTFGCGIVINSPGGTVRLLDNLTCSYNSSSFYGLLHNAGTFDANGFNATFSGTSTYGYFAQGTATKVLAFGSNSVLTFAGGGFTGISSLSITGTGTVSLTSATSNTFAGAGINYTGMTLNKGGAGALSISGVNTFSNITNTYSATGASTITFNANQTVAAFTATGASGAVLTLNSNTAGTQRTIALTGGGTVTTPDYLNVKDLSFTPFATDGTAPYNWYAGANSTNSGNNSGIAFIAGTQKAYLITSGTSFTTPGDWNNSSNNIYLIGGGGGGGGSRATSTTNKAGGAGGGGGGFRALTNQTLSGSVAYSVGSGGTAGSTAGGTGGTGGTTTFNAQTATGGGGGSTTTTPTSVGGTGGAGTYTGGTGGAGSTTTTSGVAVTGGGGGGAAGPNGNGGNGGVGFPNSTGSNTAGGGGGGNGGGSAGGNASSGTGGTGGNNFGGTGGGASNTAGTVGGGGGGGAGNTVVGLLGGAGIDVSNTVGGGGGAGGGGSNSSGTTSTAYGAGGSGGSTSTATATYTGGAGGPGMIFIIYTPSAANTGNFFFMF